MSELQEIEVDILPDGSVKIHVRGAKGKKCLELTKKLEALLGGEVVERTHTDEYSQESDLSDNQWATDNG